MLECNPSAFALEKVICEEGLGKLGCDGTVDALERSYELTTNCHFREHPAKRLISSLAAKRYEYFLLRSTFLEGFSNSFAAGPSLIRQ